MSGWIRYRTGSQLWRGIVCGGLLLGLTLKAPADERIYTVKSHDTLNGIARRYGITPGQLAEYNGLTKGAWVYVGQHLTIPSKARVLSPAPPRLNRPVQRAIDAARVTPGRWKYIVIHHSGVDVGTVKAMDRYHREVRHMEHGLAYHFVIGNGNGMRDGEVAVGARWRAQLDGGHLASETQNKVSLGICLVGNFDQDKPTPQQMASLVALVDALLKRCHLPLSAVKTHQQINIIHTRCPGRYFPYQRFMEDLRLANAQSADESQSARAPGP